MVAVGSRVDDWRGCDSAAAAVAVATERESFAPRNSCLPFPLSLSLTFLSCQPSLCALLLLNSLEGASLSGSLPLSLSLLFSFRLTSSFSSLGRVRPLSSSSSTPASELGRGKGSRSRRARACKVAQEGERERESEKVSAVCLS